MCRENQTLHSSAIDFPQFNGMTAAERRAYVGRGKLIRQADDLTWQY